MTDLEEGKRLLAAATGESVYMSLPLTAKNDGVQDSYGDLEDPAEFTLVAWAVNNASALIDEVERLRRELKWLRAKHLNLRAYALSKNLDVGCCTCDANPGEKCGEFCD